MIKNYIKTAFRALMRNKLQAIINITGLSIGLASSILILLFIWNEFGYDQFHPNAKNTYRVYRHEPNNVHMKSVDYNVTSAIFLPTAKQNFPEIKFASRIWTSANIMTSDDKRYEQEYFYAVDPDFLQMFALELINGDKETALKDRNSVMISERIAKKYFSGINPMGQLLKTDEASLKVTAVFKKMPSNTHFEFDILVPFELVELYQGKSGLNDWFSNSFHAYIQLHEGVSELEMEQKFEPFIKQYMGENEETKFLLQSITDIHLKGKMNHEIGSNGDIKQVMIFGIIGIFILLIASFNYMNLSTARSIRRAKEVGLRKVIGANQSQLFRQFIGESFFLTFISLIIGLILIEVLLPYFNEFVNRSLSLYNSESLFFLIIFILTLGIAFLSGSYPALYLSRFIPEKVLKGVVQGSKKTIGFRNILVVLQFVISVSLIICTIIVISQLNFIKNKKLGFDSENIIAIPLGGTDAAYLKNELLQHPGVLDVTSSNYLPSSIRSNTTYGFKGDAENSAVKAFFAYVDFNFLEFYNIRLIKGEKFKQDMEIGKVCIINQETYAKIGLENPFGTILEKDESELKYKIIGEIENFHFAPLHHLIQPAVLIYDPTRCSRLSVKLHPDKMEETISFIDKTFTSVSEKYPFVYYFMDDLIDKSYIEEAQLSKLFNFFTVLAVFIAFLGLFGLVSFIVEQKTREFGIRKVLGATVKNIVVLLSRQFFKWILIANIIAWPIAWYFMDKWLVNFAYHIKLNIWIFILSGVLTFLIAALTAGFQSVKAAYANPVESLKYE